VSQIVRRAPNDLQFRVFGRLPDVPVTWALSPTTKYKHVGTLLIEMHENSYKFGPELIITLESIKYPAEIIQRAPNNGVWRMEVCAPARGVYQALMAALPEIHARLNGIMGR